MNELAEKNKFNRLERIHKICLTNVEFTAINGLLTPSMKMIRYNCREKFVKEIEALYSN